MGASGGVIKRVSDPSNAAVSDDANRRDFTHAGGNNGFAALLQDAGRVGMVEEGHPRTGAGSSSSATP